MKTWIVTDGEAFTRVQADEPRVAFDRASGTVKLDRAQAWELDYQDDVEVQLDPRYRMINGVAIADVMEPGVDPTWHDDEPETVDKEVVPADRSKVVICLGYGVSRPLLPRYRIKHKGAELWTLNADRAPGMTRHFQPHTWDGVKHQHNAKEIIDTSDLEGKVIVYTQNNYPFDKVRRCYFCSSVDYMLALADLEGFGVVCMPGLDFGGARRPTEMHSARYWVGVLEGKGAKVCRSPLSLMFRHIRYGPATVEALEAFDGNMTMWRR